MPEQFWGWPTVNSQAMAPLVTADLAARVGANLSIDLADVEALCFEMALY